MKPAGRGRRFEELAWSATAAGELSLRRRFDPVTARVVYEVKLGDEYLMSSQFIVAEEELARLAFADLDGQGWGVVVGGLGLGYTACAVLDDDRVASLVVLDVADAVIDWHGKQLVPLGKRLVDDGRVRLLRADFFAAVASDCLDPGRPGRRFDAVLVDIDHSPTHLLAPEHAPFYTVPGLQACAQVLRPGGAFGLWSDEPADAEFLARLRVAFAEASATTVVFDNPLRNGFASNTIYLARTATEAG